MPGYFEDHWNRMLSYSRCITSAPLVGTRPTGTVSIDANRRPQVALPLGDVEVDGLRRGIGLLARTFLAGGDIKPIEVLAGTRHGRAMRTFADVDAFERELTSAAQLRIGTGHPQGGNAMSTDTRISVVDEQFRVRGFANLRVCDASVFPEVAGVNPQWTVLAVAHHCGRVMTGV
jgi:choline dehydrogenase-like flavoprotein